MSGHLFVIQGSLAHLDYDAVIVPTDEAFSVLSHWNEVLNTDVDRDGECLAEGLMPLDWPTRGFGRAEEPVDGAGPPLPTWFIDAGWYEGTSAPEAVSELTTRLSAVLNEIATAELIVRNGRPHRLVALPTLGVGAGGFGSIRGEVIDALLTACQEAIDRAPENAPLDVVIVAFRPSDYTAFQSRRRDLPQHTSHLGPVLRAAAQTLADLAASGELALFLGAGVSIPAGLPSWNTLLDDLCAGVGGSLDDDGLGRDLSRLTSDLDKAELLYRVYREVDADFGKEIATLIGKTKRYAITHAMLASLGCAQVVTTNYDQLYEDAAKDIVKGGEIATLPFDATRAGTPWVLKMHGDIREPESIVLSRSDFVSYDAKSRPLGSVVQALMITKHLLVVGTSMTDDNFLRLAHEVFAFNSARVPADPDVEPRSPIGTVVTLTPEPLKARLWKGRFNYVAISDETEVPQQARDLAIFLDLVALFTARNAHLIDTRYETLLATDAEREAVRSAQALVTAIDALPSASARPWQALREELRELGAREPSTAQGILRSRIIAWVEVGEQSQ